MNKSLIAACVLLCFAAAANAQQSDNKKPEWAGKGKPTAEQLEAHKQRAESKQYADDLKAKVEEKKNALNDTKDKVMKEKDQKEKELNKGLEKQQDKKSEQEMKEAGKGSDNGQDASSKKKKWWQFWN